MPRIPTTAVALVCVATALPAAAETIVHEGRPAIFGGLPADVFVPQFDDVDGQFVLDSVTFESLSSMRGGFTDPRNGQGCVDWWLNIQVDYYLDYYTTPALLNTSGCGESGQANCNPGGGATAVDVFCTSGYVATVITDPAELARWVGFGEVVVTAEGLVDFGASSEIIEFGAGGSALYRVTYDYSENTNMCVCETDGDSAQVDVFDLLAYLDLWFPADPAADIDGTASVDVFDLLAFLDCWFTGC